jgi:hypothetical protein
LAEEEEIGGWQDEQEKRHNKNLVVAPLRDRKTMIETAAVQR